MGWFIKGLPKEEPKPPVHNARMARVVPVGDNEAFWVNEEDAQKILDIMGGSTPVPLLITPFENRCWSPDDSLYSERSWGLFALTEMYLQVSNVLSVTPIQSRKVFNEGTSGDTRYYG